MIEALILAGRFAGLASPCSRRRPLREEDWLEGFEAYARYFGRPW